MVRYFDHQRGKVRDRFLAMIELERFDAQSMHKKIIEFLEKHQIPIKNIIGFASDNASVMMGKKGGVRAFLKK